MNFSLHDLNRTEANSELFKRFQECRKEAQPVSDLAANQVRKSRMKFRNLRSALTSAENFTPIKVASGKNSQKFDARNFTGRKFLSFKPDVLVFKTVCAAALTYAVVHS